MDLNFQNPPTTSFAEVKDERILEIAASNNPHHNYTNNDCKNLFNFDNNENLGK